jgi:hypothetical protein
MFPAEKMFDFPVQVMRSVPVNIGLTVVAAQPHVGAAARRAAEPRNQVR